MRATQGEPMPRNLLICLDGTSNEPETGATNVARLFGMAVSDANQLTYYDPGVGTMGSRGAATQAGAALTRTGGLLFGHGIKQNLEESYGWLMSTYKSGDRIFIVGFSRGAYTAVALAGMLRTVGLLHPGAENLVPYAVKMYAQHGKSKSPTKVQDQKFFGVRSDFNSTFGNSDFPGRFEPQVDFLGLWDTVKTVGWFNWKARFEQAHWPFTRILTNVRQARLALAIDERRRPFAEYRFSAEQVSKRPDKLREMWFAGVHSDVGGQYPDDHDLSDVALAWIADEAHSCGLRLRPAVYDDFVGAPLPQPAPQDKALGKIHHNGAGWAVLGLGWRTRRILPGDAIHPSVLHRIAATKNGPSPYRPPIPVTP
jgi:uncharacterized protein (DUF2235 family)